MRPIIHKTLMDVAEVMSQRGTCSRLSVGAIISKNTRVVSSGWNGAVAGAPHCVHLDDKPCEVAAHAEENAIVYAARAGISTDGASMYCTHAPCSKCARLIVNAGIKEVFYRTLYRSSSGLDLLKASGVDIYCVEESINGTNIQVGSW
jgi:dCMP deaminase